jgi:hypothetical protein
MTASPDRAAVITWDWREQPDLDHLARLVHDLSDGRIHLRPAETGTDQYGLIIATRPVDDATARGLCQQWQEDGEDVRELDGEDHD